MTAGVLLRCCSSDLHGAKHTQQPINLAAVALVFVVLLPLPLHYPRLEFTRLLQNEKRNDRLLVKH